MPATKETHLGQESVPSSPVDIINISGHGGLLDLRDEIAKSFNPAEGAPRTLPTLLLYDEKGLKLFEEITYLDEYYLTNNEIEVLKKSSADIASNISDGSLVIELGSGNLRKICLLLQALEDAGKKVDYYALDLNHRELERTLALVPKFKHVSCHGLYGTYDDGQEWLKQPSVSNRPKFLLHLGSSIGNFNPREAAEFLGGFANVLNPTDSVIIGIDSCSDAKQVYHAYNDRDGLTHRFTMNALDHANFLYGEEIFNTDDWEAGGEYVYDGKTSRHQAFVQPVRETSVLGSVVKPHERVKIEVSLKYSLLSAEELWKRAGLRAVQTWSSGKEYGLHMLKKSRVPYPLTPSLYASKPLPTLEDWESLWEAWDMVTQQMIPEQDLVEKPIKLRNACIFYLGHIPAFLDIQLTRTTKQPPTDPAWYHPMFERGIDPDVDDPSKCHDHSEIPSEWPPVSDILAYQSQVRSRLRSLYSIGQDNIPRGIGRAIWLGFEHEIMHLETLLYMMLQSDKTLPPTHTVTPDFAAMARGAAAARVENQWFDVPEQTITLGMDDAESELTGNGYFGWDIEKPSRAAKVHKFQAKGRPITNNEYAAYLHHSQSAHIPASWAETPLSKTDEPATNGVTTNGAVSAANMATALQVPDSFLQGKSVRTVYGLIPLKYALDWPVFASYEELSGCAAWMGGRVPTFEEARSIYAYVDLQQRKLITQNKLEKKVPAVNGHLVNDGVEETPPSLPSETGAGGVTTAAHPSPFVDLSSDNVGFSNWHPTPITHLGGRLGGQASLGGVWEWTSTPLARHEAFEPMALYPGYSADFFDGKHNVVLGGSWASHPRIAGRKSFVNWYQRNYPYAWAGVRMVRDVE